MLINFSSLSRQSILGRALRLPLSLLPADLELPILQGPARGTRWVVGASNHGCWLGSYEYEKQHRFQEMIEPGDVVYDVGAHAGFYTLMAASLVGSQGRVVAFEPDPRNLRYLRYHVDINDLVNVGIRPVAVSNNTGLSDFAQDTATSQGHLANSGERARAVIEVNTVCLDDIVGSRLPPPDLVKIDIEGGEVRALKGARNLLTNEAPVLFLATHGSQIHEECVRILRDRGYTLQTIGEEEDVKASSELIAFK